MRKILFLGGCWLAWLCSLVSGVAAPDSLYTLKHLQKIHLAYPDSALHLIDSMQQRQMYPEWMLDAQRSLVYNGQQHFRLTLEYARAALAHDSLTAYPSVYLQTISCLQEASRHAGAYREGLEWLRKGVEFARIHQNLVAEATFWFDSAQLYALLGQPEEAERYYACALQLAESGDERLKPYLSYFYGVRSRTLGEQGQYEEALALCQKRLELVRSMESLPNIPEGYLSQQYAYVYGNQAYWLACLGRMKEAEAAYRRFRETPGSDHETNLELVARYGMATRQYDRVALRIREKLDEWEAREDLTPLTRVKYLTWLVQAYEKQNDYRQAFQAHRELAQWNDTLQARQLRGEVAEQAALYGLYEKDWIIQQQVLEAKQATLVFYMLLVGLAVACSLLWATFYHMRTVKQKNRTLVEKIGKLMVLQDRVDQYEQQIDELKGRLSQAVPPQVPHPSASSAEGAELPAALADTPAHRSAAGTSPRLQRTDTDAAASGSEPDGPEGWLFKRIDQAVKEEKLYLNPNFGRQDILDRFSVDKNTFSRLMQEYAHRSLPQYLADLRVKHAIQVLISQPNYTLQAVSDESGFSNLRSFHRHFKAATGMTPLDYRQAALKL